jgi:hypothetical protein
MSVIGRVGYCWAFAADKALAMMAADAARRNKSRDIANSPIRDL